MMASLPWRKRFDPQHHKPTNKVADVATVRGAWLGRIIDDVLWHTLPLIFLSRRGSSSRKLCPDKSAPTHNTGIDMRCQLASTNEDSTLEDLMKKVHHVGRSREEEQEDDDCGRGVVQEDAGSCGTQGHVGHNKGMRGRVTWEAWGRMARLDSHACACCPKPHLHDKDELSPPL